jgi:MFS family permease
MRSSAFYREGKPMNTMPQKSWLSSYHAVTAFAACIVLLISNGMTLTGLTPFRRELGRTFGWTAGQMTFSDFVAFGTLGLLAPFLGVWMDKFGVKRLMMLGGVVLFAAYWSYGYVSSLPQMYAVHVLFGLALALCGLVPAARLVSRWFNAARGTAMGISLLGSSLASYVFAPWATKLIPVLGVQASFHKLAWSGLLLTAFVALVVRDKPEDRGLQTFGGTGPILREENLPGVNFEVAIRSMSFWCLAIGAAMTFFSMLGTLYNLVPHMLDLGFDVPTAVKGLIVMLTAAMVGKLGFGMISDYLPAKTVYVLNLAVMFTGAALMALSTKSNVWTAVAIFGLGWGGLYTMLQILTVQSFGVRAAGKLLGTMAIFDAVGGGLGSWVMGMLRTSSGNYHSAFWLMSGLIAIGLVVASQIRPLPGANLAPAATH